MDAVDGAAAAAVVVHPAGWRLPDQRRGRSVIPTDQRRYGFLLLLPTELFCVGFGQRWYVPILTRVDTYTCVGRYTCEFACITL